VGYSGTSTSTSYQASWIEEARQQDIRQVKAKSEEEEKKRKNPLHCSLVQDNKTFRHPSGLLSLSLLLTFHFWFLLSQLLNSPFSLVTAGSSSKLLHATLESVNSPCLAFLLK